MTTPSPSDGSPASDGGSTGDAPYLPPARPATPASPADAPHLPSGAAPAAAPAPADAPHLPSGAAPAVAPAAAPAPSSAAPSLSAPTAPTAPTVPAPAPSFDAKAMVESQKHYNVNPAYGAMPAGTDESRAAARKLRENANRKRRRGKTASKLLALIVVAGIGVAGYFVYEALQDDPPPLDGQSDPDAAGDAAGDAPGDGGALTPVGEQEQVIDVLDDLTGGATPSAGGLLDAVDDARDAVGQAEPPVATEAMMVADVFTPAVLDHTDVLDPIDGSERFVVRTAELAEINPTAHTALVDRLVALPQAAEGDERLAAVPVVLPGDIGIAIERDGDRIVRLAAVAADPPIRAATP